MKLSLLFLSIALLAGAQQDAQAQYNLNASFGYATTPNYYRSAPVRKEVRELKAFVRQTERFEYALYDRNLRQARRIKADILERMRDEVYQTKDRLFVAKKYTRLNRKRGTLRRRSDLGKRNSNADYKSLVQLERRLERQLFILEEFEYSRLNRSSKSALYHKRLLKQFTRILRNDIQQIRFDRGY